MQNSVKHKDEVARFATAFMQHSADRICITAFLFSCNNLNKEMNTSLFIQYFTTALRNPKDEAMEQIKNIK